MLKPYLHPDIIEAGCDEAGRGCLCGPVSCAAVILPPDFECPELNDSKQLTEKKREELRPYIESHALAWAVVMVDAEEIDRINILNASILGMHRALDRLPIRPHHILVDGNRFKPYTSPLKDPKSGAPAGALSAKEAHEAGSKSDAPAAKEAHEVGSVVSFFETHVPQESSDEFMSGVIIPHTTVVKGDATYMSIAAASILAKTHRDELMNRLAKEYPGYGWEENKGYPTKSHRAAIAKLGPTPLHRLTFRLTK